MSHQDQITKFPRGAQVKTLMLLQTVSGQIPVGSLGRVRGHCDDGRAYITFEFDNSSHTFHATDGVIEVVPPPSDDSGQYCPCCGSYLE